MTDRSARFALPFLIPGQAQKETFHNEALAMIDGALHACVEGTAASAPPSEPGLGDGWIVPDGASGAWSGKARHLAVWTTGGWRFVAPVAGMLVWNKASGHWVHWTGDDWADGAMPATALIVAGQQVVGSRLAGISSPSGGTTIDSEARAAIDNVIVALRTHGLID